MRWILLLFASISSIVLGGCSVASNTSQSIEQAATERNQQQLNMSQPVPAFSFSQERETLIQIYKLRNDARNTYTVFYSDLGQPLYSCPSMGFPIPGGTQLTNPEKVTENTYVARPGQPYAGQTVVGTGYSVLPQAEPNGLYTDPNTNSTWVLCVRQGGEIVPVYSESKVMAFPFPVRIEDGKVVDAGGAPSAVIEVKTQK